MNDLEMQHDWLECASELDVPTDEEVQMEISNLSCGDSRSTRRFGAIERDWSDGYDD